MKPSIPKLKKPTKMKRFIPMSPSGTTATAMDIPPGPKIKKKKKGKKV